MYTVGLTGGIGSGKSAVAAILQDLGAGIVDTDAIAHALTAPHGAALPALRARFGDAAIGADGALDRAWMRTQAFEHPAVRRDLEAILHPLIWTQAWAGVAQAVGPYCVLVVPLLFESGRWRPHLDRVCVVDCEVQTQIQRVQARSGLTRSTIERIMSAQVPRSARLAAADDVIINDAHTSLDTLHRRTVACHRQWCVKAARRGAGHPTK